MAPVGWAAFCNFPLCLHLQSRVPRGRRKQVMAYGTEGPNVEASPYPSALGVRGLAPSLAKFTGKPLRAFHG